MDTVDKRSTLGASERVSAGRGRQISYLARSALTPHPNNVRKHTAAQIRAIAKSIDAFGFAAPILADKEGFVLAGNARLLAADLLELTEVPVIFLDDLTETQAKAYMLADNKLTDRSTWDEPKLAVQLKQLSDLALDFDIEATGFEAPEIDFRIQSLEENAGDSDDHVDLSPGPAVSALGDVWYLGNHRICCGNALEQSSYTNLMTNIKASAVFTDPPYNVKINGNAAGHGKTSYREFAMAAGEMSEPEFIGFLTSALSQARLNVVSGAIIYACMDWRHMQEILVAARASNIDLVNLCVWVKPNGRLGSFYKSRHELVFVFKNGSEPHQNNVQLGRFGRNRTNVWNYASPNSFARYRTKRDTELHPTIKPVLMVSDAILDCTRINDIVLDPFLGSGTTLLAAERTGRRCYGMELNPLYVDAAIERWQRMTGRKALNSFGETFDFVKTKRRSGS
jgi:DNA modification methylase